MSKKEIINSLDQARLKVRKELTDYNERLGNLRLTSGNLSAYQMEKMHALEDAIGRFHAQMEYLNKAKSILTFVYDCWLEEDVSHEH